MRQGNLADLDELTLRCQNPEVKVYVDEAVACYKIGAFRACIVLTWTAVVCDFIEKMKELTDAGEGRAKLILGKHHEAQRKNNISEAQNLEQHLLEWAHDDFELLSHVQKEELERLQKDRNRCAHISMMSEDEIYHPTAEQARYHLRNAIEFLIQHEPVQGRSALERLRNDIKSKYFPIAEEKAVVRLKHRGFSTPKSSLLNSLIKVLLQDYMLDIDDQSSNEGRQIAAAIKAYRITHRELTEQFLETHLSKLANNLPEEYKPRMIFFLSQVGGCFQFLNTSEQEDLAAFIGFLSESSYILQFSVLTAAIDVPELRDTAIEHAIKLPLDGFTLLLKKKPLRAFLPRAVEYYTSAGSVGQADRLAEHLILPLIHLVDEDSAVKILRGIRKNSHLVRSTKMINVVEGIKSSPYFVSHPQALDQLDIDYEISTLTSSLPDEYVNPDENIPF
ncbi:MAG: hypothetical protein H6670_00460 [Anaerolineaceae bacterium]|nr:hypothetical protein [Anaerolineaceae bacterium]